MRDYGAAEPPTPIEARLVNDFSIDDIIQSLEMRDVERSNGLDRPRQGVRAVTRLRRLAQVSP
jgi:hypothetical protein